jgi:hypothetical protein
MSLFDVANRLQSVTCLEEMKMSSLSQMPPSLGRRIQQDFILITVIFMQSKRNGANNNEMHAAVCAAQ